MKPTKKGGWFNEPRNHGLAAKGIKVRPNKTDYKKNMMNKSSQNKIEGWNKKYSTTYSPLYVREGTYGNNAQEIGVAQDIISEKWEVDFFNIPGRSFKQFETKKEADEYAKQYMKINKKLSPKFSKEESDIMKIDEALKKNNLKFYAVIHSKDYPDDAKTYILENTEMARLTAKNEKDAKRPAIDNITGLCNAYKNMFLC